MPVPFTKEADMSYISEISPDTLASTNASYWDDVETHALAAPAPATDKLAAGLEIAILLAMLSGLSLAFCTIAAGAF